MSIQKTAIIGAGAIGCYLLWGIRSTFGDDVCLLAEGERKERLSKGITINDELYTPPVKTPEEAKGVDLIFVAVKYNGLEAAVDMVRRAADEHTLVVSVMNGVTSEKELARAVDASRIVPAFIRITSERLGSCISFIQPSPEMGIQYGEPDGNNDTERIRLLSEFFARTPLVSNLLPDITTAMWGKFALNISENLPQAIFDTGVGVYATSEHAEWMRRALWSEVKAVAAAKGITLPKQPDAPPVDDEAIPGSALYSTLQDIRAKRPTEIDMFSGALIEMGRELGVPTPYNEVVYHTIKTLEEKNRGMFEF